MAISSPISRSPEFPRHRPRSLVASSPSAPRSSITAPTSAISMRCLPPCSNSARSARRAIFEIARWPAFPRRSGRAPQFGGGGLLAAGHVQKLLLVGDQLLGFLQRLIEIAAEDAGVDTF